MLDSEGRQASNDLRGVPVNPDEATNSDRAPVVRTPLPPGRQVDHEAPGRPDARRGHESPPADRGAQLVARGEGDRAAAESERGPQTSGEADVAAAAVAGHGDATADTAGNPSGRDLASSRGAAASSSPGPARSFAASAESVRVQAEEKPLRPPRPEQIDHLIPASGAEVTLEESRLLVLAAATAEHDEAIWLDAQLAAEHVVAAETAAADTRAADDASEAENGQKAEQGPNAQGGQTTQEGQVAEESREADSAGAREPEQAQDSASQPGIGALADTGRAAIEPALARELASAGSPSGRDGGSPTKMTEPEPLEASARAQSADPAVASTAVSNAASPVASELAAAAASVGEEGAAPAAPSSEVAATVASARESAATGKAATKQAAADAAGAAEASAAQDRTDIASEARSAKASVQADAAEGAQGMAAEVEAGTQRAQSALASAVGAAETHRSDAEAAASEAEAGAQAAQADTEGAAADVAAAFSRKLFRPRSWGEMAESETFAHLEHLRLQGAASSHRDDAGYLIYECG